MTARTDALARHLEQLLTSPDDSAERRVGSEFVLLDSAGREKLVHDITEVYGAGDPEYQVAARLWNLMNELHTTQS